MTWVPPFYFCGDCGGEIGRYPHKNLLREVVLVWRHRTVPDAWRDTPHQAILGTKAHTPDIRDAPKKAAKLEPDEGAALEPAPEPTVPARPALAGDLPASATRFIDRAESAGWAVRAWYMRGPLMTAAWKFSREVESIVVHADRDGHRLVAAWQNAEPGTGQWTTRDWPGTPWVASHQTWRFDEGWSLTHFPSQASSTELNAALTAPRAVCESCGEPPALHYSSDTGPVCWAERHPFL